MAAITKFCAVVLLIGGIAAANASDVNSHPLDDACLVCLCHAVSGCRTGPRCAGDACGLFQITTIYWTDAYKPTVPGKSADDADAFASCAIDPICSKESVQRYMTRYRKDCNGDGTIDCRDYLAIHIKGPEGCGGTIHDGRYMRTLDTCLADLQGPKQQG